VRDDVLAHGGPHPAGDDGGAAALGAAVLGWGPLVLLAVGAAGYAWLSVREHDRRGWPVSRTLMLLVGTGLLGVALSPGFDRYADRDFGGHMAQHLLLGMVAPLAIVLSAPVTLLLRQLPHRHARRLGRLLHGRVVRLLSHPVPALLLSSGGLVVLYFTPLFAVTERDPLAHAAVHGHVLAAGLLFAWAIAGPDPAPGRASVRVRLVVLGAAIAIHSAVAQLIYAGVLVQVREPVAEMRAAGSLMYFGGDIAELMLAVALLATWRASPRTISPRRAALRPRRASP